MKTSFSITHPGWRRYLLKIVCSSIQQIGHTRYLMIHMKYCDGGSLRTSIESNAFSGKLDSVWEVFRCVLRGLEFIHSKDLIHRDIKPVSAEIFKNFVRKIFSSLQTGCQRSLILAWPQARCSASIRTHRVLNGTWLRRPTERPTRRKSTSTGELLSFHNQ